MSARLFIAAACLVPLAGCATFGTNVKGDFACSAPDGICAPSSVIDDRALALIAGERGDAVPEPAVSPALLRSRALVPEQVARPSSRMLRIVFPAHVDGQGRYHETSVVRAVVDQGTWLAATDLPAAAAAPASLTDADAAASVMPAGAVAIAAAAASEASPIAVADARPPSAEAVAAARARVAGPVTRAAVAAEVKAVLARPTNAPAGFPAKVED